MPKDQADFNFVQRRIDSLVEWINEDQLVALLSIFFTVFALFFVPAYFVIQNIKRKERLQAQSGEQSDKKKE
ncbi:hypothetical protein SS50377_20600 [Spironucleus salmonicida]|uniref:Uncharacterized protein n=1 Tax=Spironucleus salmonicida TaxID=348837 RepID=V6LMK5_9EUKA|nr:hypothetical protein SS50377_28784 [Spironucleus salmonicida]KAH0577249.1 hypothetical protein SS50377_20600 [Spironucleus salmonicida]|eukprot:EST45870.1 Hypothetical protein SS50377_14157 [Spironucleus salmonicida]